MRMQRSDSLIKITSLIVFLALICYIGYNLIQSRTNPLKTVIAVEAAIEDGIEVSGYVVRSEAVIASEGTSASVVVDEGEKVSVGQVLAIQYHNEAALQRATEARNIEIQIEQLQTVLNNSGSTDHETSALNCILSLSNAVQKKDFSELDKLLLDVDTYIFQTAQEYDSQKLMDEIASLNEQLAALEEASDYNTISITADSSGIFSSAVDGYETVSPDALVDLTPDTLTALFKSGQTTQNNVLGKMISEITWYYATVIDYEDTAFLETGNTVHISFTGVFDEPLNMEVTNIGNQVDRKCVVIFSCNKFMTDISAIRDASAEIITSSYSGLRIPKESVHLDEDNNPYVYVLVGMQAKLNNITILGDMGEYYIVAEESGSTVRRGAEIIVNANDLYDGKVVQ